MEFRLFLEMSDIHALFRAALDRPDDETPRLVAADWLDDHSFNNVAAIIRLGADNQRGIVAGSKWGICMKKAVEELKQYGVYVTSYNSRIHVNNESGKEFGYFNLEPNGLTFYQLDSGKPARRVRLEHAPDAVIAGAFLLLGTKMARSSVTNPEALSDLQSIFYDFQTNGTTLNPDRTIVLNFLKTTNRLLAALQRWNGNSDEHQRVGLITYEIIRWAPEVAHHVLGMREANPALNLTLRKIGQTAMTITREARRINQEADVRRLKGSE